MKTLTLIICFFLYCNGVYCQSLSLKQLLFLRSESAVNFEEYFTKAKWKFESSSPENEKGFSAIEFSQYDGSVCKRTIGYFHSSKQNSTHIHYYNIKNPDEYTRLIEQAKEAGFVFKNQDIKENTIYKYFIKDDLTIEFSSNVYEFKGKKENYYFVYIKTNSK